MKIYFVRLRYPIQIFYGHPSSGTNIFTKAGKKMPKTMSLCQ